MSITRTVMLSAKQNQMRNHGQKTGSIASNKVLKDFIIMESKKLFNEEINYVCSIS